MEQTGADKIRLHYVILPLLLHKNIVELFPTFCVIVNGSSRTDPQVCAIGRLANPSKVKNWTEIHGTQMTSAPVTYLKKDFS